MVLLIVVGLALSAAPQPESADRDRDQPGEGSDPQPEPQPQPEPTQGSSSADPPTVTVTNENGSVEIRFDPDGVARAGIEGRADEGEFDLVPGTGSGVRLAEDGRLEPVPAGVIGPEDLGFTPTDGGVDVHAPDNPLIELRPDGRSGGVSATEFDGETVNSLTGTDGTVVLNDGTSISPIEPPGDGLTTVAAARELPWRWIVTTIMALAVASALTGYLLHRNHIEPSFAVTTTGDWATDGTEDFDGFLDRLAADPDPTRAIRLAFHTVEQGLSGLPVRRAEETPFEWHRRVGDTVPAVEPILGRICDLYAMARFAPGRATDQDRSDMIAQLRQLVHGSHAPRPTSVTEASQGS